MASDELTTLRITLQSCQRELAQAQRALSVAQGRLLDADICPECGKHDLFAASNDACDHCGADLGPYKSLTATQAG